MNKFLINGIVFVVIFAASAGGSWYYTQMNKTDAEGDPEATAPEVAKQTDTTYRPDELNKIFAPGNISAEALLALARRLETREKAIIEKEEDLKRAQYQVNVMLDDTQRERDELTSMHAKLENEIGRAQSLLEEIGRQKKELDSTKQAIEETTKVANKSVSAFEKSEVQQVARIAKYYADMPEETAASLLKQMCDGGRLEFAGKVISALDQKKATKILVALDDNTLVNQLLEQVKDQPVAEKADARSRRR